MQVSFHLIWLGNGYLAFLCRELGFVRYGFFTWRGRDSNQRPDLDGRFWKHVIPDREKDGSRIRCVKLKIGAIDFEKELALLRHIRTHFSSKEIELRVDANGAFSPGDAMEKLKRLSEFDLHSIEQPICAGQWEEMARLAAESPLAIALDEDW